MQFHKSSLKELNKFILKKKKNNPNIFDQDNFDKISEDDMYTLSDILFNELNLDFKDYDYYMKKIKAILKICYLSNGDNNE